MNMKTMLMAGVVAVVGFAGAASAGDVWTKTGSVAGYKGASLAEESVVYVSGITDDGVTTDVVHSGHRIERNGDIVSVRVSELRSMRDVSTDKGTLNLPDVRTVSKDIVLNSAASGFEYTLNKSENDIYLDIKFADGKTQREKIG